MIKRNKKNINWSSRRYRRMCYLLEHLKREFEETRKYFNSMKPTPTKEI
jgi:hypothetical protein|tara:strand:- start:197 stop:343 length:147 start_codon:yes stop_codon:yes gene_type:complete